MIVYLTACAVLAYVVWQSGRTVDGGWRFAPLRATGMLCGGIFRIIGVVAMFAFALIIGVLVGTARSTL